MKKKNNKQKENDDYEYRDTARFWHGVAVVCKNGKFGYVGKNGEKLTPLKYDEVTRFHGFGGQVCIDGKWGLVDTSGKEITPLIYEEIEGGQAPIVKLNGKYGFINKKTGELLTPVKYDEVCEWTTIADAGDENISHKSLAKVKLNEKYGCVNLQGQEIIPLKYDEIIIHHGDNHYTVASIDGKWGLIDDTGTEITRFEYDSISSFSVGRARVEKDGKYGFIDNRGVVVIPIIYDDCESYFVKVSDSEPAFPVVMKIDGKYGYVDISGNEVVKPVYEHATSFHYGKGMAAAVLDGKFGFIDETGKTVIPFIYEQIDAYKEPDKWYGYRFWDNYIDVKLNGKWGVIDRKNNVILPFIYDEFLKNNYAGFRYALRDGEKLSVDTKGTERIMRKNQAARTFKDYLHAVTVEDILKSGHALFALSGRGLEILTENFNNFSQKTFRPSQDIIRIHAEYNESRIEKSTMSVDMYCVEKECSYGYFDWAEILDMEVRIEDDLTLSDADVVALCIWGAGDQYFDTEETIFGILDFLNGDFEYETFE